MGIRREPNAWSRAFAAQVRAERAAADLTQRQVYEGAGISARTYSRIESDELVTDIIQLAGIADALGIPMQVLVERAVDRARRGKSDEVG